MFINITESATDLLDMLMKGITVLPCQYMFCKCSSKYTEEMLVSLLSYDAADSGWETPPDLSSLLLTPAGTNGSTLRVTWPSVHQEVY